jgi:thioredoxin reductase (NADPH)
MTHHPTSGRPLTLADLFDETHEVLIAGSGPAGLTAAIYAARANLNPVLVEGEAAGGQLVDTTDVENFPGFAEGILGPDLIAVMRKQAERFGTRFLTDHIVSCDLSKRPFTINLRDGKSLRTQALIISTGASARWLGIESEEKLKGHGVTACATCDGFFFKGKEVAVIGGGDTAMEEATFLTKFCTKVTVIHRRDELRASKIMQDRAMKNPKIEFKWNSVVEEVYDVSQNKVTGLKLRNTQDNSVSDFACEGLFLAIGHDPNTGFLDGQLETDKSGFIVVQTPSTRTSVPGVFACGDVMDPTYKQAVTAAGTGCQAAIDAERYLEAEKG